MIEPTPTPPRVVDQPDRRIRRSWWMLAGTFSVLALVVVARIATDRSSPVDWLIASLVGVVVLAAVRHQAAVRALEAGRREEAETFARILSGLSRSVSPDAIVAAIVRELGRSTGADHIVVVCRRAEARVLDATLVSTRPGVADSSTTLPIEDLEEPVDETSGSTRSPVAIPIDAQVDPAPEPAVATASRSRILDGLVDRGIRIRSGLAGRLPPIDAHAHVSRRPRADLPESGQFVADRIARRVRAVYGLRDTIAAPLTTDAGVVGAIVLSRRVQEDWPPSSRRILAGAAIEASAALARAYSHRAAEARASTDALTGLPNRGYFDEFCGLLARRRRAEDAVGVLMIDIDRFKILNDTYGHAVGDEVLRAVGGAIVAGVREEDVPARFGGEEFVVLLRNPGATIAVEIGERVRMSVRSLDLRRLGVPAVSVSVGVAVAESEDEPIAWLVERADRALYRAKRAGRDRVVAA